MAEQGVLVTCDNCSKLYEFPGKYIYPVPGMGPKRDNRAGIIVCPDCSLELHQMQIDEGLLLPPQPVALNLHAWKETP